MILLTWHFFLESWLKINPHDLAPAWLCGANVNTKNTDEVLATVQFKSEPPRICRGHRRGQSGAINGG
jgi:hypothetical protein